MLWRAGFTIVAMGALLCFAGSRDADTCAVTLRLTDAATGRELPGLVRITDGDGKLMPVAELMSRGLGLGSQLGVEETAPIHSWRMLPAAQNINLPRKSLTIEAISGLETELALTTIDLTGRANAKVVLPLTRFSNLAEQRYRSANTHVHLMKVPRADCDRYLKEVTQADRLDALFLSYLERTGADHEYTSNKYTSGDLASLSRETGVAFGNGEEHRHNMEGYGEGYGHVMLLDIQRLVQPVSIGPGIMKMGTDGIPLRRGIDSARKDGATIVWCHNRLGTEDVPNLIAGRIDAQNIFDGSVRDSYKDSFYRYLDIGLDVPFSTGTDWFVYDFSRAYCRLDGDLSVQSWLKALANGRSFITNGPLIEFNVESKGPGEIVNLSQPGVVKVIAKGVGRSNFERIELVQNGNVIHAANEKPVGAHFEAQFELEVKISEPSWLALRTPPPPVKDDPALATPVPKNELGHDLFSHTSAVAVEIGGKRRFVASVARALVDEMKASMALIEKQARFADDAERQPVLDVYRDGIESLEARISQHKSQQTTRERRTE